MEPAEDIPAGSAAYELRALMSHADVALIVGAKPSSVYRWATTWGVLVKEPFRGRLLLTHELAFLLAEIAPDLDIRTWFFNPQNAAAVAPADQISAASKPAAIRERLVVAARVSGGVATDAEIAAAAVENRRHQSRNELALGAAWQLLEVLRPLITSGKFGVVRDRRVLLVPAEAVEQVRAVDPASLAVTESWLLGQGLAALGARTYGGKNSVARRIDGRLTRVWDIPLELLEP